MPARTLLILFLNLFYAAALAFSPASGAEAGSSAVPRKKARVLLVNSYHENMQWTKGITSAVEDSLARDPRLDCVLSVEYMDTKNIFTDEYLAGLRELYAVKFRDMTFDAVITSDDDAFNFCADYQQTLFKGVPLVFCGVNNFEPSRIAGKNISGVVEAFDIKANIELIRKIHPGVSRLFVINDKTTTGAANKAIFQKCAAPFSPAIAFEYLEDMTMDEVCSSVSKIGPGSAIFLMTFNRDRTGKTYSYEEGIRLISEAAKVPIYGVWDFYLGGGITGGLMISGRSQGEAAAKIASEIIAGGKKASDVPVVKTSPNRYMFDYKMLAKNGIDEASLPEESFILNKPFSFYSIDKNIFWFIMVLIAILAVMSAFLIVNVIERRAAEKELLLVNRKLENMINELENIVDKRTRELLDANRNLKQEIAGREKAQKELLASETKYRMLAENALDVIIEADLDGSIIYMSPNFGEVFGAPAPESRAGAHFESLACEADRVAVRNMFAAIAARGFAKEVVFRGAGFDSKPVWLESSGKLFTSADGTPHAVIVTRNVTERKKIEDEMVKNAKLESLGILAGGIAHDFNNVLMGIIGNVTLARRRSADASVAELLARAEKVSYKAKSLTEQLITFSKGGQPIKKSVGVNELICEAVQFALSGSSMKSEFFLDPSLWPVEADEGQITQVITNITINARQACGENGVVVFRTVNVPDGEGDAGRGGGKGRVKITVSDNGCGIEPADMKKIFDPYFTTKPDGRGIGLAAAYSIIRNHNGSIEVESKRGEGTSFHLYLPAR